MSPLMGDCRDLPAHESHLLQCVKEILALRAANPLMPVSCQTQRANFALLSSKQSHSSLSAEMQLSFGLTASILKLWQERPKLLKPL